MEIKVTDHAETLYNESLVWDMVWPWEPWCGNDFDRLSLFRDTGFNVLSMSIAGDRFNLSESIKRIAETRSRIYAIDYVRLCENVEDIKSARDQGQLAVLLHFEGTMPLELDLNMIEVFYKLGVRHNLLAFNNANNVGGGAMDTGERDGGLTAFGKKVVREMERVGMLVDLSHVGHRTALETLELAENPCLYTHSNPAALFEHPRNISDQEITACAATGGLVGIPGSSMYHGDTACKPQTLFRHLDHIVQLVGSAHAGLGLDYFFDTKRLSQFMRNRPEEWPEASASNWPGVKSARLEDVLLLTQEMVGAGYSDQDVRNILGENYIRICSQVWK